MDRIAKELVSIARGVLGERKERILTRAEEHEMNVDAEEERPVRGFDKLVRLLSRGGRDGRRLTQAEWEWLEEAVDSMGPPP